MSNVYTTGAEDALYHLLATDKGEDTDIDDYVDIAIAKLNNLKDQEVLKALQHDKNLRHCVHVGHWDSKCGNCHSSVFADTDTGKINCNKCGFALDHFTADYVGEPLESYQAVFPQLEYYPKYEYPDWFNAPHTEGNTNV
jgi:hypothetical protein